MTLSPESSSTDYLDRLQEVADEDVEGLKTAQHCYGNSWKSRGGVGAFMMLARKWDRLENRLKFNVKASNGASVGPYDIFGHCAADNRSEGLIDDVRDLRRYLLLVEAELRARNITHGKHRDN